MSRKLLVIPLVLSGLVLGACSTKESTTDQKIDNTAKKAADAAKDAAKKTDAATEKPPAPAPEKK
jgi:hypothetical protein